MQSGVDKQNAVLDTEVKLQKKVAKNLEIWRVRKTVRLPLNGMTPRRADISIAIVTLKSETIEERLQSANGR